MSWISDGPPHDFLNKMAICCIVLNYGDMGTMIMLTINVGYYSLLYETLEKSLEQ